MKCSWPDFRANFPSLVNCPWLLPRTGLFQLVSNVFHVPLVWSWQRHSSHVIRNSGIAEELCRSKSQAFKSWRCVLLDSFKCKAVLYRVAPKLFIRKATKACKLYLFRSCQVEQDRRTKPTSEMSELMNWWNLAEQSGKYTIPLTWSIFLCNLSSKTVTIFRKRATKLPCI